MSTVRDTKNVHGERHKECPCLETHTLSMLRDIKIVHDDIKIVLGETVVHVETSSCCPMICTP